MRTLPGLAAALTALALTAAPAVSTDAAPTPSTTQTVQTTRAEGSAPAAPGGAAAVLLTPDLASFAQVLASGVPDRHEVPTDLTFADAEVLATRADSLSAHAKAEAASATKVAAQHSAWEAEQAALAAQRAAEAAAAQAATQDTSAQQATGSSTATAGAPQAGSGSSGSADYTLYVGGYCADGASCAQSAVDSSPLAYIDYPGWGFSEIAGHNYGAGGVIASFRPGATVRVNGNGGGLYRITGLSYVAKGASIPGGGFVFQTCVGSQMVLAWATKIG